MRRIAHTREGRVRGSVAGGVARFLGVPYAAPPVGRRRFALPEPVGPWSGVREAVDPGPNAPQVYRPFPGLDVKPLVPAGWRRGDDFLTLNVWEPEKQGIRRPVIVFIHGGGFVAGDKDAPAQDGSAFARSGVVFIAINYRLGIEGFLPIPGVPTNLGLRDQLAALEWVRRNAAAFGGDPANVTLFGESAGAMAVAALLSSPLAKGLFRRAIVASGHGGMVRSIEVAQRLVKKLARMLGVSPDVDGFRSKSVEESLVALDRLQRPLVHVDLRDDEGREPAFGLSRFLPVFGDDVLPRKPLDALAAGAGADVDLLIGTNREEMNLYLVPNGRERKIGGWLAPLLLRRSEPKALAILTEYGLGRRDTRPADAYAAAMSDCVFRWPARRFAAAHRGRTHFYELGWRSPACEGRLGACHGLELPFVFDTLACTTGRNGLVGTAPPRELACRAHGFWVAFAKDGRLPWPEYDGATRQVLALESGTAAAEPPLPVARVLP